jgi:hypothetical protein
MVPFDFRNDGYVSCLFPGFAVFGSVGVLFLPMAQRIASLGTIPILKYSWLVLIASRWIARRGRGPRLKTKHVLHCLQFVNHNELLARAKFKKTKEIIEWILKRAGARPNSKKPRRAVRVEKNILAPEKCRPVLMWQEIA